MSHYCVECSNSGERGQSGMLDCGAKDCTAATERATLDAHLLALGRLHERDLVWAAYKLGQAKAEANGEPIGYITRTAVDELQDSTGHITENPLSLWHPKSARVIKERAQVPVYLAAPTNSSTESTNDR